MDLFYRVKLDWRDPIEGSHTYALPFAECPDCGEKRASGGVAYPWIDGKEIFDTRSLRRLLWDKSGESTWSEYLLYFKGLREALPPDLPVAPGTNFGRWKGRVYSQCPKLLVVSLDTLLAERSVLDALREEGLSFQTFDIELRPRGNYEPDLVEIWAPPVGYSFRISGVRICPTCERGSMGFDRVNASTIPPEAHVFRLRDAPNELVFSKKFVEVFQKLGLQGFTFVPVPHEFGPERASVSPHY